MRLGTRLLLPLVAVMTLVMLLFAVWSVRQRERIVRTEAQREAMAYAVALGLALEAAYRDPIRTDVQEIIDRIGREETIHGVLIYAESSARSRWRSRCRCWRARSRAPGCASC
jgi:sensor histidine kinase regulating citrate/malate metabolism